MPQKVIIIGAGVSGLCVGSYLQMNGFETRILEQHDLPGGVCTAWKRKGYTFDACIHWLMGSGPGTSLHEMWKELHAVQGRRFLEWEVYMRVRTAGGETFTMYTDPGRLEAEMLRLSPEDGGIIHPFCQAIRKFSCFDMPVGMDSLGLLKRLGLIMTMAGVGPVLMKWGVINVETWRSRFRGAALRDALGMLYGAEGSMPDFPVSGLVMMLAYMHRKSNGYPIGGSLEFVRALERRYTGLGGTVSYGTRVDRIIVEGGRAVGVRAAGQELSGDVVISCADGHATLFDMLEGRWLTPALREAYETYPVFPSLLFMGIGIARDMSSQPAAQLFTLKTPLVLEDGALTVKALGVRFFHFDPTTAPAGKTAAVVSIETRNHGWWTSLRTEDPGRYREAKRRLGEMVVDALEAEIGGIKEHVEVVDVATPATWIRYTGNWQGSYEGFLPTRAVMMKHLGFTIPGLEGFYMHGQWSTPGGGLPPAGMNGRKLAQIICRSSGLKFRVSP
jgi:phytoene dehydrogenase-like protein